MTRPPSLLAVVLLAGTALLAACSAAPATHPRPRTSHSPRARPTPTPSPADVSLTLAVQTLPTSYGVPGTPSSYPATLKASVPPSLTGQVAAYGVAGAVIVGPAGWTGSGAVGADGSSEFTLSPGGTATGSSSAMVFHYDGSCAGCAWEDASAYFTEVAQALPSAEDEAAPSPAAGLQSESLAPGLVGYSLPDPAAGVQINGIAHTNLPGSAASPLFEDLQVTLPASGHSLATLLLNLLTANQDRYLCPSGSPTSTTSLLLASGGVC